MSLAHLPTLMLVIGYPLFWIEMLTRTAPQGVTSPTAWLIFIFFVFLILWRERKSLAELRDQYLSSFKKEKRSVQLALVLGLLIGGFILSCSLLGSMHPPHLMQESDTMNYHLSMPRQHLILGSFEHIPWSADDFFYLPVDFALAPFWFVSELPNKVPQFIFFLGLLGVVLSLAREMKGGSLTAGLICLLALLGSHGHGVQMGTAMMDLPICYLFLSSLDSFLKRQKWLFLIEFSFFAWAKSLVCLQIIVLAASLGGLYWVARRFGVHKLMLDFQRSLTAEESRSYGQFIRGVLPWALVISVFVAGPFMLKSVYYTGTPFFPVGFGKFTFHPGIAEGSTAWESLGRSAEFLTSSIHRDGYGRSIVDFFTHFWALSVPDDQVNNAFDYPLGLSYLIFLGPFVYFLFRSLRRKEFALLPWMTVLYWILWWLSVRETRHLYAPVVIMMIVTAVSLKVWSKVLMAVLLTALALNAVSIYRAHSSYFGRSSQDVLRAEDKILVELSRRYLKDKRTDPVELEQSEVAFAQFPVIVRKENLPHVIAF